MERLARKRLVAGTASFALIAFASYFDVWSHRNWFIGVDPWYNPAHLLLYSGFLGLFVTAYRDRASRETSSVLVRYGLVVALLAASFNEFWHRVLLYGNPLPEPFPVEPPHVLLALGLFAVGAGLMLVSIESPPRKNVERLAASVVSGSMWLVVAGSFFYLGSAYGNVISYLTAVFFASFSAALFLRYTAGATGRFGFATGSYILFLAVNYVFFVRLTDGLPLGIALVAVVDYLLTGRLGARRTSLARVIAMLGLALLYGIVYYPLLPISETIALNPLILASLLGVILELGAEKTFINRFPQAKSSRARPVTSE